MYKHRYIQSLQTIMKFCWSRYYSSSTVLWQGTCHTPLLDMTMIYDIYAFLLLYLQNAGEKFFGERKKWKDYNWDSWDITSRCYMSAADARYPGSWRFISIGLIPSNCYDRNMVLVYKIWSGKRDFSHIHIYKHFIIYCISIITTCLFALVFFKELWF